MLNYVKASGQIWIPESGQGNTPKVPQPRGWSPMTWFLHIWVVVIVAVICISEWRQETGGGRWLEQQLKARISKLQTGSRTQIGNTLIFRLCRSCSQWHTPSSKATYPNPLHTATNNGPSIQMPEIYGGRLKQPLQIKPNWTLSAVGCTTSPTTPISAQNPQQMGDSRIDWWIIAVFLAGLTDVA